ncbi:MAG: hypothetical protein U0586_03015 [Candidatus Brocadiaceae bacterium]
MKAVETQDFASLLRKRPSQRHNPDRVKFSIHFDGAQHVVIASVCSDDLSRLGHCERSEAIFPS